MYQPASFNTQEMTLPQWDLSDLYPSQDSSEIINDLQKLDALTMQFVKNYDGKLNSKNTLLSDILYDSICQYECIEELLVKLLSYAHLCFAVQASDPATLQFYQKIQENVTLFSSRLNFFIFDLNTLYDSDMQAIIDKSSQLKKYQPWVDKIRTFRSHQLTPQLEKLLSEKRLSGHSAWTRLFEETVSSMRFVPDEIEMTLSGILHQMNHELPYQRQKAAQVLSEEIQKRILLFTLITNTLAKDKEIDDSWRGYTSAVSQRNLENRIEDEVVHLLIETVKSHYAQTSHRYYKLKSKWLNVDRLEYWDRNAPLLTDDAPYIGWQTAKSIVLDAYKAFSPMMAKIGEKFFSKSWIDADPREGKDHGAFAHPTVPTIHPYVLLNYRGKIRDVMVLAHELGHGIHQVLSGTEGLLLSEIPLTLAETASVFGEMLTFKALLQDTSEPKKRRFMLAAKVEDMLNTVVRQVAFFEFERQVHERRREQELLPWEIGEIWLQTQKEALGPAVHLDVICQHFWACVPHFIHVPFYSYAYAFGDCLVNALYTLYESGDKNFVDKYIDFLGAGGRKHHSVLLEPFGLNVKDPSFWSYGLKCIAGFVDELEHLSKIE